MKGIAMRLIRSLVLVGMSTVAFVPPALAADYYVKPLKAGPVNGTPLAAITLQAQARESLAAPWRLRTKVKEGEDNVGKWLKARKRSSATRTETTAAETATTSPAEPVASEPVTSSRTVFEATTSETTTQAVTTETGGTEPTTTEAPASNASASDAPATEGGQTTLPGTTTGGTTTTPTGSTTTSPTTGTAGTQVSTAAPAPNGQVFNGLDALFKSGKLTGGDRVFLMDGYHGPLNPTRQRFTSPVLFAPVPGQVAQVDSILVRDSANLVFNGLKVWATSATASTAPLIRSYTNASDLVFANLDIRSVATAGSYMQWTLADWINNKRPGMMIDGSRISVVGNRLTGIGHGILAIADNTLIEKNIIDGFSGDGMRALGDFSVVRGNRIQNCVKIDANHDDGFQSYATSTSVGFGVVKDLTLEDNKIFEWASSTANPLRCVLQGIGMFDGMYDNLMVRNNVVSVTSPHGIAVAGTTNATIVNNTVVHADGIAWKAPWIKITNHKSGTATRNVVVANNLTTALQVATDPVKQILVTNNLIITNPSAEFVSASGRDYTLRTTSKAVDAGAGAYAPKDDIVGALRPKGAAPDLGAYEVR